MKQGAHLLVRRRAAVGGIALVIALTLGAAAAASPSSSDRPTAVGQASGEASIEPITASPGSTDPADAAASDAAIAAFDLTYNTTDACRLLDSRQFQTTPIPPNTGFSIGLQGDCGIPTDGSVKAIMVNIISVGARGTGYVRQAPWPFFENTNATVLNFNGGLVSSNGIPFNMCDSSTTICDFDFDFVVFGAATHIVIDIVGYFAT
jgi:hypothetical protein